MSKITLEFSREDFDDLKRLLLRIEEYKSQDEMNVVLAILNTRHTGEVSDEKSYESKTLLGNFEGDAMTFSSSIITHTNDEAETPLCVEYDYEDGRVEITSVHLISPPFGWASVSNTKAWEHWDYSNRIDADATMLRCAEHAKELLQDKAERMAAEKEHMRWELLRGIRRAQSGK